MPQADLGWHLIGVFRLFNVSVFWLCAGTSFVLRNEKKVLFCVYFELSIIQTHAHILSQLVFIEGKVRTLMPLKRL